MATGDASDFHGRIVAVLPPWFPDPIDAPVVYALISGISSVMAQCYSLLAYVRNQTRLATSTDGFLDLFALDFFGQSLSRRPSEMDTPYRARISASLFLERATRAGMISTLKLLTGTPPAVFEPSRPQDTFCLGYGGLGYGALGSYSLNNQAFVTVYMPASAGGGNVAGLGSTYAGLGAPHMAMPDPSSLYGSVTSQDVYAAVEATRPVGSTIWVQIKQ